MNWYQVLSTQGTGLPLEPDTGLGTVSLDQRLLGIPLHLVLDVADQPHPLLLKVLKAGKWLQTVFIHPGTVCFPNEGYVHVPDLSWAALHVQCLDSTVGQRVWVCGYNSWPPGRIYDHDVLKIMGE